MARRKDWPEIEARARLLIGDGETVRGACDRLAVETGVSPRTLRNRLMIAAANGVPMAAEPRRYSSHVSMQPFRLKDGSQPKSLGEALAGIEARREENENLRRIVREEIELAFARERARRSLKPKKPNRATSGPSSKTRKKTE
ncbi:MAG TPA: hypothetical protein VN851_03230 [Thermoanaerobaculia bacterium]|nr:hypothetical protein [Thermoanaerobaculia bacterium]